MTVGSWRVRTRRTVALTVAVVAGIGGVTGCSAQSGAAAVVDGEAIPIADVHEATRELGPYLQDASPSAVLLLLVAEPVFARVAAENGVGVSAQEAQEVLDGLAQPAEGQESPEQPAEFGPASQRVARFTILQRKLQERPDGAELLAQATADLAELDVELNPRYGQVDFASGTGITPVAHDWLVPAETVAP